MKLTKTINHNDSLILLEIELDGHTERKLSTSRYSDWDYITLHKINCYVNEKLIATEIGNDYDLAMNFPQEKLISRAIDFIESNEEKFKIIKTLKELGYN